jgi:hypothetical protein
MADATATRVAPHVEDGHEPRLRKEWAWNGIDKMMAMAISMTMTTKEVFEVRVNNIFGAATRAVSGRRGLARKA